jgi:hypothetical protein
MQTEASSSDVHASVAGGYATDPFWKQVVRSSPSIHHETALGQSFNEQLRKPYRTNITSKYRTLRLD